MFYKDGTTEPKKDDTVLGDKFKGVVAGIRNGKLEVRVRGAFNPKRPDEIGTVIVEKDSSTLELVHRK